MAFRKRLHPALALLLFPLGYQVLSVGLPGWTSGRYILGQTIFVAIFAGIGIKYFLEYKGIIITREKLLNTLWGLDYLGDERTVDTHIRRLREKVGENIIRTHRGMGYSLEV